MKKLLKNLVKGIAIVGLMLGSVTATAQTITDKNGNVFDIRSIEKGAIVDFKYEQQGIFVFKYIMVDFETVAVITKKSIVKYNGTTYKKRKLTLAVVKKMFKDAGFELTDRRNWQELIPPNYIRNHYQLTFKKVENNPFNN